MLYRKYSTYTKSKPFILLEHRFSFVVECTFTNTQSTLLSLLLSSKSELRINVSLNFSLFELIIDTVVFARVLPVAGPSIC